MSPRRSDILETRDDDDDAAVALVVPLTVTRSSSRRPAVVDMSNNHEQRIRLRFLQRLGIASPLPTPCWTKSDPALLRPSRSVVSFEQALNDDPSKLPPPTASSTITCTAGAAATNDNYHVHFDASVRVIEIPGRHNYSHRIAQELWMPLDELQENAARNSVEFAAEHYDWTRVVNEDDMVVVGGELVHPVHFGMSCCDDDRRVVSS